MIQDTTLTDGKYQFDISTVYYREDGSYVITLLHPSFGALPYHVPNEGEYADKWAELNEWRKDHEENFQPEPEPEPTPVPEPTIEEQADSILKASMRTMAAQLACLNNGRLARPIRPATDLRMRVSSMRSSRMSPHRRTSPRTQRACWQSIVLCQLMPRQGKNRTELRSTPMSSCTAWMWSPANTTPMRENCTWQRRI